MERSQYLARALAEMEPTRSVILPPMGDLSSMKAQAEASAAWEAANPGKSRMGAQFQEFGQNLQGAPGRMATSGQALLKAMGGF